MHNLNMNITDNLEYENIKSSIKLLKGKGNSDNQDGAMHFGFTIGISKKVIKDMKILRYISNLIINKKVDVSINLNQTSVQINVIYIDHLHANTILELNSHVEDNINLVRKILNVFQIHEYEIMNLFYIGDKFLKIEELII